MPLTREQEAQLHQELAARRAQMARYRAAATPEAAANTVAIARRYPGIYPGVATALGMSGISPDSPVVQTAAVRSVQHQQTTPLAGHAPGDEVESNWLTSTLKTAVRGLTTFGLGAAHELVSRPLMAAVRSDEDFFGISNPSYTGESFREAYRNVGDSPLFQAADEMVALQAQPGAVNLPEGGLAGSEDFLGTGFLPGGRITQEYQQRTQSQTIPGTGIVSTPGTMYSALVFEPGSKAHDTLGALTDVALALFADPVAVAGKGLAVAQKGSKVFGASGLVQGMRRTTLAQQADDWIMNSKEAGRLADRLAEIKDFDTAWKLLDKKVDVKTVLRLVDETNAGEGHKVKEILRPLIGTEIREKLPTGAMRVSTAGIAVKRRVGQWRWMGEMPGGKPVSVDDLDEAVEQLDRLTLTAKLDPQLRSDLNRRVASIDPDDIEAPSQLREVFHDAMSGAEGVMRRLGASKEVARDLSTLHKKSEAELRAYWVKATTGDDALHPGSKVAIDINGTTIAEATPHAITEMLSRSVFIPDTQQLRAIRRQTDFLSRARDIPGVKPLMESLYWTTDRLTGGQGHLKALWLARGAYTVRVIGEEQVRMGAAGMHSFVSNPASALAWVTGAKGNVGLLDEALDQSDEIADALNTAERYMDNAKGGHGGVPKRAITGDFIKMQKGQTADRDFVRGWHENLARLWNDPIAQRVAAGGLREGDRTPGAAQGLDGIKDWLIRGSGKKFRRALSQMEGGRNADLASSDPQVLQRAVSDYVDSYAQRIKEITNGNADLVDAIRTGKIDGIDGKGMRAATRTKAIHDALITKLDTAPEWVSGSRSVADVEYASNLDKATEFIFYHLNSRPTNYLSRSTAWKQSYWQRAQELIPFADEATQKAIIRQAEKAGLERDFVPRMKKLAAQGSGDKLRSIEEADTLAKVFATDATKSLLYDLQKKSQFFDMTRLLFPFGEAFKEILTTWAKLGVKNPAVPRRMQQAIAGAKGSGFVYTDEDGTEKFGYGPLNNIAGWMLDGPSGGAADVGLAGRVEGLNLFGGSFIPGLGPAISVPLQAIIPETPRFDDVRELLFPYGVTELDQGVLESQLPAWMGKLVTAFVDSPENNRLYANAVTDMMQVHLANGTYSNATPEAQRELERASIKDAKWLMVMRGILQSVLPTGPELRITTEDVNGDVWQAKALTEAYYKMVQEAGGDEVAALENFESTFGVGNSVFIMSKSKELQHQSTNVEGARWERDHADVAQQYEDIIGLVAPGGAEGEFDFAAYGRQFETGARVGLKPDQVAKMANDFLGRVAYEKARRQVEGRTDAAAMIWLAEVKAGLKEQFPGFATIGEQLPSRLPVEDQITQLGVLANDSNPAIQNLDAVKGLRIYMEARANALAAAQQIESNGRPLRGFQTSDKARYLRDWLRQVGQEVVAEHKDFAELWTSIFSREIEDDEEVLAA